MRKSVVTGMLVTVDPPVEPPEEEEVLLAAALNAWCIAICHEGSSGQVILDGSAWVVISRSC